MLTKRELSSGETCVQWNTRKEKKRKKHEVVIKKDHGVFLNT